jgi:hypothetical protein
MRITLVHHFRLHIEEGVRTGWQDPCTTSYDLLPSGVQAQNRCSREYMLGTVRRISSHRSVHWPQRSSQSAWRSGTLRVSPSNAMQSRRLYQAYSHQHKIMAQKTNKSNRPTVNKNGHREKVSAGVCNLGSSTVMNGCKDKPTGQRLLRCAHASTRTFIRV